MPITDFEIESLRAYPRASKAIANNPNEELLSDDAKSPAAAAEAAVKRIALIAFSADDHNQKH